MASNTVKECGVCNEEFDEEDRRPRCLPCLHSICSDCTDQLIARNKKSCLFCSREFQATSTRDVGVNVGLIETLKLKRNLEEESLAKEVTSGDSMNWKEVFRIENEHIVNQNISFSKEAQEKIDTDIKRNNEILNCLIQENQIIRNEIMVSINNIITTNEKKIEYLQKENRRLSSRKKILEEKQSQSERAVKKLGEISISEETSTIIGEIEKTNSDVKTLIGTLTKIISAEDKAKTQIDKATKRTNDKVRILQEVLHSSKEEDEELELILDLNLRTMEERTEVTIETLRGRTEPVLELLRRGRIFARHKLHGWQRYARISVCEENRICLHYLRDETLQHDAYTLEHSDVMNLVDSSSRLAFLELSDVRKEKFGCIYIRLHPQTKRADQFSLMCTGEEGPCYANTKVLDVYAKGKSNENICFGDYENQDGTGGKALVSGVWEKDPLCCRALLAGSVWGSYSYSTYGEAKATQFGISTRTQDRQHYSYIFGIVEDGLQILKEAIQNYANDGDFIISDCGLVLEK